MRIMTVAGTRPEIIRLSRIVPLLDQHCEHTFVHTGQNFSDNLSKFFFEDLNVRAPDEFLGVDTSSFGRQLGTLFEGFETLLDNRQPDKVLILGDTNSALVAFNCKRRSVPVYHMEAGNRCYDDRVPEEVNRRVIDHCSSVLLPYTHRSAANLVREGIERERIFVTGNPIFEVLEYYRNAIDASPALKEHGVSAGNYILATMHRAENVDAPDVFKRLCGALGEISRMYGMPLILSVHPRIEKRLDGADFGDGDVRLIPAMRFFEFVHLEKHAALVVTDSGTVQEECAIFQVPVITIRDTTERPETMEAGTNIVTSTQPDRIIAAARFVRESRQPMGTAPEEYLEPVVSGKIMRILLSAH
jgi:UDP-N-acetylglucosamine 2-epimerase (non-hydrolysing)